MSRLTIRYAKPDTIPAVFGPSPEMEMVGEPPTGHDYWALTGPHADLVEHVNKVLAANDLNDYTLT